MASALDKIRHGLEIGIWKHVAEGFEMLTGEYVEPGRLTKDEPALTVQLKKRGRPKKTIELATVTPVVKPNKPKSRAPTKQEVDDSIIVEDREKEEARTQKVRIGRKPTFISE